MAIQILRVLAEVAKTTPAIGLADSLMAIGLLAAPPVNIPSISAQQHSKQLDC